MIMLLRLLFRKSSFSQNQDFVCKGAEIESLSFMRKLPQASPEAPEREMQNGTKTLIVRVLLGNRIIQPFKEKG